MKKKSSRSKRKEQAAQASANVRPEPAAPAQEQKEIVPPAGEKPAAQTAAPVPARTAGRDGRARLWLAFFPVALFLAMTVQTRTMSLILLALALVLTVGKVPMGQLRARLSVPTAGFLAFLLLCTAGSLYSQFGSYAIQEFVKIGASGALALMLLARGRKEDVRGLLWGFAAVCSAIAVLCVDFSCAGPLFSAFSRVMSALGATGYEELVQVTYTGARFDGIYGDANLTGSLLGLGMLVCLYLAHTAQTRRAALPAHLLLGLCGVSFWAATSRGAMLCFGAALVVYLIAEGRGNRLPLFFLMLFTGLSTALLGTVCIRFMSQGSVLGTVVMLPCGVLSWALDALLTRRCAGALAGRGKVAAAVLAGLGAAAVVVLAVAVTRTTAFQFTGDNMLYRAVAVDSGKEYTISADWDGGDEVTVVVYGSNGEQALLGQTETYYNGPLSQAAFTVPQDVEEVFFQFRGPAGGEIRSAALSDGTRIPMAYTLLPENIVVRFQGNFLRNSSFLLRVQYDIDGLRLFAQSPLTGHGLGASEGLLTAVQPFFYESLYIHNHLIQVMDETGLLGLASFLAFLGGVAWLLIRRLRRDPEPLAAVLLACCAMMNLHGLMEISFSVRMFQCAAFYLLVLAVMEFVPRPAADKKRAGASAWAVSGCVWLWSGVSFLLILGCVVAGARFEALPSKQMTQAEFMSELKRLDWMDCYTDSSYKVNLMANALQTGDLTTATSCAAALTRTGEFDACYQAAAYYYLPLGRIPEFFSTVQLGLAQERSNKDAWNSAFQLYRQAFAQIAQEDALTFVDGVLETGRQLEQANEYLIGDVTLDDSAQSLLKAAESIRSEEMDEMQAYLALSLLLQTGEE